MGIRGNDQRQIIQPNTSDFNTPPLPAVTAVDAIHIINNQLVPTLGSGIVVAPNYVLTAAHNIYDKDNVNAENAIRVRATTSADQVSLDSRDIIVSNQPDNVDANSGVFYLPNFRRPELDYRDTKNLQDDIALLKTNNTLLDDDKVVGLMAFVNPEEAIGKYPIRTAGYPGDNVPDTLPINNPNNPGIPDKDGEFNQPGDYSKLARDLVLAPGASFGNINDVYYNRAFNYTDDIDTFKGQSGSGVWHVTEENEPLVLGIHNTEVGSFDNSGVIFTKDLYDQIIDRTKDTSIVNGNSLPENLIIGSDPSFIPIDTPFSTNGNDEIIGTYRRERIIGNGGNDYLYGGGADDRLEGGEGDDILEGGEGDDRLDGGIEDDVAVFSDNFENYEYEISESTFGGYDSITFTHPEDGTDTLYNIEWAEFGRERIETGTLVASSSLDGISIATEPRLIPLPLEDGVEATEFVEATDTTPSPNLNDLPTPPNVTLSAPVAMLDGDVDYTLNISPYQPNTIYNISYIIDTSASMDAGELQQTKDAYTDLTNYFIDNEIAENINFGIIQFSKYATPYFNLTAEQAISTIGGLTASTNAMEGTKYNDALYQGMNFLSQSAIDARNTTNIAYFVSDGRSRTNYYDPYDEPYVYDAMNLRRFANVQAFGIDDGTNSPGGVTQSQLNFVDSNQGLIVGDASNLSAELQKSGLADKVQSVNILVDGEVVDTIAPEQLTDSPLGLTYEGSVDGLDVSIDAENIITAEVVFADEANLAATTVDYTVTAGESEVVDGEGNDIAQSSDGNEDPFERIVDGGDSDDEITLGYADRGANGGAGNDEIIGNRRDNILDGGAGNDTISAYEGDDIITTGAGRDKVDGGEGIDTAVYNDVAYQDNSITLRKVGNSVSYNNTDTLTDVEFIQLSDVRISTDTLEITPVVEVAELSITEGDSELTTAQLDFNLSTPAPIDISFDYSSEDLENGATAGVDYTATSGTVIIPAGETSASINLEIIGDKQDEEDEQFGLNFFNLSGATFGNNLTNDAVGITISDDDITLPDNAIAEYGTISNLSHTKQTIDLINTYTNPVVFVQPPSYNEEDPAIVRLDNITADSFEAMIQEPEHNDGIHSSETASYFVFEAGSWQFPDGTLLEVGTNSSSGLIKQGFDEIEFEQDFETSPVILSTVQTNNGTQFVRTRQNNITKDGFSVGMEEEEANQLSGHATEELGWLAIEPGSSTSNDTTILAGQTGNSVTHEWSNVNFNNLFDRTPQLIAGISSYDGSDPSGIRYRNLSSDAVEIKVEEDQSSDIETDHTTEVVDFLAVEGSGILSAVPTPQETIIGEVGTITNLNHLNQTITLNNTYTNPVVFALPLSYNDEDPAIARIHDIESDSFSVYLKEPEYLDDQHADETVTYLVIEAGSWQLEDGTMLEVGSLDTNQMTTQSWEGINLKSDFSETPAVLSFVQTDNGTQFVRTRQKGKSVDGFELSFFGRRCTQNIGTRHRNRRLVGNGNG